MRPRRTKLQQNYALKAFNSRWRHSMIYFAAMSKLAIILIRSIAHILRIYSKTASPVPITADLPPGGIPSILICTFRASRWPLVILSNDANKDADACLDFRMEPTDFLQIRVGGVYIIDSSKAESITVYRSFHRSQRWRRCLKQSCRILLDG